MTIAPESLILDFLEWIANKPRPYREVMAAWRTSCPKLTVWEDSIDAGYVVRASASGQGAIVCLTPKGQSFLHLHGRSSGDAQ